jgi:hypothetical protein
MKAKPDTAAKLRAIIRWTSGTLVAASITAGACLLFPLLSSFTAFSLTLCLSAFIGLNIALPPMDPEDDWVPIRSTMNESPAEEAKAALAEVKESIAKEPAQIIPLPGMEIFSVHHHRATGTHSGSWNMAHPEFLRTHDASRRIELNTGENQRHSAKSIQFPAPKKG